ncbi:hypothetical protein NDU88_004321 [Pleurodeles waltl]|uniref:Uncharacterized protein n=1 Tax=Pleurodeles waltl TaxID=8319 RepID=A0AAV7RIZ9_PLEWA|nr:hypothetical protein NDU88_004321 [Pleurodeles waltl]
MSRAGTRHHHKPIRAARSGSAGTVCPRQDDGRPPRRSLHVRSRSVSGGPGGPGAHPFLPQFDVRYVQAEAAAPAPCDGPGGIGPSVEADCADTTVDDPERKDGGASPFMLPELKGTQHEDQGVKNGDEEEGGAAEEEENVRTPDFGRETTNDGRDTRRSTKKQLTEWTRPEPCQRRRRRTAKTPATLQEKRGITRCVRERVRRTITKGGGWLGGRVTRI